MAHLTLVTGNRVERLVERLAEIVSQPLAGPLVPDIIVVQSKGMERWIRMALARINGICANAVFPFPRAFLEHVFQKCFPDYVASDAFDPEAMAWRILARLDAHLEDPAFEPLSGYLKDADLLQYYGISRRIAHVFDQYLVFRPDMLFSWESGKDNDWQAALWRELTAEGVPPHQAHWLKHLAAGIRTAQIRIEEDFHRICIFGISYLPPVYLEILAGMARRVPVYLFLMNPCREYWSDIVSDFQARRIRADYPEIDDADGDLHMERGNRLLSAWGVQGKQFFSAINALEARTEERFEAPAGDTLLSAIQRDIFTLSDPEAPGKTGAGAPLPASPDPSVQVHACHSPLREMEVLHDLILDLFESEAGLLPQDILVMTPDIETYAPFIQAVFGAPGPPATRIPFHIADRRVGSEGEAAAAVLSLLSLYDTRLGAAQVLGLLDYTPVRRRFGLAEADTGILEQWVRETRIRWGIDASDRARWGVPGFPENTWEAGLERMLLGYAMVEKEGEDVAGILPYGRPSGDTAVTLSRFLGFFDHVIQIYKEFNKPKNIEGWISFLNQLLEDFLEVRAAEDPGLFAVQDAVQRLGRAGEAAAFDRPLDFPVVRAYLETRLGREAEGHRFASEGVTFCTLLPMRSIPAEVICLVGMNDGAFPREDPVLTFDRMARHPRAGDRSRRRDDKYLFLEALLSARRRLYISHVGLSIQDNSALPPSVLVTQLLEYIREGYGIREQDLVIHHRLHPFSAAYFRDDPALFSYSEDNFNAAKGKSDDTAAPPFIEVPLPAPQAAAAVLDLDRVCRFLAHPSAFFLKHRLGIFRFEKEPVFSEREPFRLDALETYLMAQDLIAARLAGGSLETVHRQWRLQGRLPHGNAGIAALHRLDRETARFSRGIENLAGGAVPESVSGEFPWKAVTLRGRVEGVHGNRHIRYRYAQTRGKDLLDAWARHLFLQAVFPEKPLETVTVGKDAAYRFPPVPDPGTVLGALLDLCQKGLSAPVPLFPQASFEYAWQRFYAGRSRKDALERARKKWTGNDFVPGDAQDVFIERCFGSTDPLDAAFEHTAECVFAPLFSNLKKTES